MATATGIKFDNGKARYDLLPPEALEGLAQLYTMGARKYADRNWEKGMKWGRIFAALMRHAWAWFRGETYAKDDGQHHLLSVAWCAFALYTYQHRSVGEDDRPFTPHEEPVEETTCDTRFWTYDHVNEKLVCS